MAGAGAGATLAGGRRLAELSHDEFHKQAADPLIGAVRGVANGAMDAGSRLFNRFSGGDRDDED